MPRFYKIGEAAKYLGRSVKSLQKMDNSGKLIAHRTATGRRYYTKDQLDGWLGISLDSSQKKTIAYVRVSDRQQSDYLQKQMDTIAKYASDAGIAVDEQVSEVGSVLDYNRPEWNRLLKEVEWGGVGRIIVASSDRFVSFGFDWFDRFCRDHGCEIVSLSDSTACSDEEADEELALAARKQA